MTIQGKTQMQTTFRIEPVKNFKIVFETGKRMKTSSAQFVFSIQDSIGNEPAIQLGFIAMKKVVGKKAGDRNRCKRRLRHAFAKTLKNYSIHPSKKISLVVLGNKNTLTNSWEQLIADIEKGLSIIQQKITENMGIIT